MLGLVCVSVRVFFYLLFICRCPVQNAHDGMYLKPELCVCVRCQRQRRLKDIKSEPKFVTSIFFLLTFIKRVTANTHKGFILRRKNSVPQITGADQTSYNLETKKNVERSVDNRIEADVRIRTSTNYAIFYAASDATAVESQALYCARLLCSRTGGECHFKHFLMSSVVTYAICREVFNKIN